MNSEKQLKQFKNKLFLLQVSMAGTVIFGCMFVLFDNPFKQDILHKFGEQTYNTMNIGVAILFILYFIFLSSMWYKTKKVCKEIEKSIN
ncbi:hypothetical protein [Bacillus arachidis]|uniref:hypothetical protein n=1 Tax=Bacillus arachidis TaxID=2819290 RepID=UPI00255C54E3|nr:hypothetical protein [Bacillus arachidis]WIY59700.1 hypothetical protein QRY57_17855 [Bacillus arachidis]